MDRVPSGDHRRRLVTSIPGTSYGSRQRSPSLLPVDQWSPGNVSATSDSESYSEWILVGCALTQTFTVSLVELKQRPRGPRIGRPHLPKELTLRKWGCSGRGICMSDCQTSGSLLKIMQNPSRLLCRCI